MAASKPLLPSHLPADDPAAAPAPRAATRLRLPIPLVAGILFTTALYGLTVRNTWGCPGHVAYYTTCYILLVALFVSIHRTSHHPRGASGADCAWPIFFSIFLAGIVAARPLYQSYM